MAGPRRIAFVVSAHSSLKAVDDDARLIFHHLTSDVGGCEPTASVLVTGCSSRADLLNGLTGVLARLKAADQLVFYFTGHGAIRNDIYCLCFGDNDDGSLAFSAVTAELQIHGVANAVILLDTCFSGNAAKRSYKADLQEVAQRSPLPRGTAMICSSRSIQTSREIEIDGKTVSVFTFWLCKVASEGLGYPTKYGRISVEQLTDYVSDGLDNDPRFHDCSQRPVMSLNHAEAGIWIFMNQSGESVEGGSSHLLEKHIRNTNLRLDDLSSQFQRLNSLDDIGPRIRRIESHVLELLDKKGRHEQGQDKGVAEKGRWWLPRLPWANEKSPSHTLDETRGVLMALHAVVTMLQEERREFRLTILVPRDSGRTLEQVLDYVGDGPATGGGRSFPGSAGIAGKALSTGETVYAVRASDDYSEYLNELTKEWGFSRDQAASLNAESKSFLAIPFGFGRSVEAIIWCDSTDREFFDGEALGILQAGSVAVAKTLPVDV